MNEDELFPAEAVKMDSPRLAWAKRHGVVTMEFGELARFGDDDRWFAGFADGVDRAKPDDVAEWFMKEVNRNGHSGIGMGPTEEAAMGDLGERFGVKLWNEEET